VKFGPLSPLSVFFLFVSLLCGSAAAIDRSNDTTDAGKAAAKADVDEDARAAHGRLIRVPLPLTDARRRQVAQAIERAVDMLPDDAERVLVLELTPGKSEAGQGTSISDAMELARMLVGRKLMNVKTVAYIPKTIKGHGVLVAMACDEIVMREDAEIGEAGLDEPADEPIEPWVLNNYRNIADLRRTIPLAVALGMLDPKLEVLKVETEVSVEYVLKQDLDEVKKNRTVQSVETLIPPGEMGHFDGRTARQLRFVKYLAKDREDLARALGLPPGELVDDPSLISDWKPILVRLDGSVDRLTSSSLKKAIQKQLDFGEANLVILQIDSPGGSLDVSIDLANYLANMDQNAVRSVAYVPGEARGEAALVALACHQLVMRPDAVLGGEGRETYDEDTQMDVRQTVSAWPSVEQQNRSWSLIAATLDPQLAVYRYQHKKSGEVQYFCQEELDQQASPDDWQKGPEVTVPDETLVVDGRRAKELGMAWDTADDFTEVKQLYDLDEDPRLVQPGWADKLVEVMASNGVAALLLFIAGVALYAELQLPGIGIGGFVASVAFLLFFWSKFMVNTAEWLEVVLFLGGVCFLLLEIFVLPGFGIFGLGGGLMVIVSLVLASQTFIIPTNSAQLADMRRSLLVVGGAVAGMLCSAIVMRRYLPRAPFLQRMMLEPPDEQELDRQIRRESVVDFQDLMGQEGVATTQLTPSGKATIDDQLLDVIAVGEVIERGTPIVVVEVHGNRVVVQAKQL